MNWAASLPMYDWPEVEQSTKSFWSILRERLREQGFDAPLELTKPSGLMSHWRSREMLFSQTCGFPYATKLRDAVHLLGRPHYGAEGCGPGTYRSAIVVRSGNETKLRGLRGKRLAYNSRVSLSGCRCLFPVLGPLDAFFGKLIPSGSHRESARLVALGQADCAALDAVCWDMVQRFDSDVADQLVVLDWAPEFPSLPFICSSALGTEQVDKLSNCLNAAVEEATESPDCSLLRLCGVMGAEPADYEFLSAL